MTENLFSVNKKLKMYKKKIIKNDVDLKDSALSKILSEWKKPKNIKHITISSFGSYYSLHITEYYSFSNNQAWDFYYSYEIKFHPYQYDRKHKIFNFIFDKNEYHEISIEDKNKICDSNLAFEVNITNKGLNPSMDLNNSRFPIWFTKISNKCPGMYLNYRAVCNDIILKNHDDKVVGRFLIRRTKEHPVLITSDPSLRRCYPIIKIE